MLRLARPSVDELERILESSRQSEPTYPHVGATLSEHLPSGYHHDDGERQLGPASRFIPARDGLRSWQTHTASGMHVYPATGITSGETVLVGARVGPLWVVAPCRIIYIFDEPNRFGFAYGTLPGHPESGEEAFIVDQSDDTTTFRIRAFSRPAATLSRIGGPITRAIQLRATRRYLDALTRFVGTG